MIRYALALALVASVASAGQEGPGEATERPDRRLPREEAFRMVDAYVVSNLQESLDLTDEQFVKLLPLIKRLQTDRRTLVQRRQQSLLELRRLLGAGEATEARVADLLGRVKAAEADEPAVLRKDRDAIDAALGPVQQAKFRILELEVERKIRELMGQIRSERRGTPGSRRPGTRPPPQP